MEVFRTAAASACFLGVVFSLMSGAVPSDKLAKQVNMIFSLILVTVIVTPFIGADISIDTYFSDTGGLPDNSYIYEERFNESVSLNISEEIGRLLTEKGIYPLKITVDINNLSDGSILINGAEIVLSSGADTRQARAVAAEALGVDGAKIIVKTEDGGNEHS